MAITVWKRDVGAILLQQDELGVAIPVAGSCGAVTSAWVPAEPVAQLVGAAAVAELVADLPAFVRKRVWDFTAAVPDLCAEDVVPQADISNTAATAPSGSQHPRPTMPTSSLPPSG